MNERLEKLISALRKEEQLIEHTAYLDGAIQYLVKTSTNEKKSVVNCTYDSIINAIKKSIELKIPVDNRDLAFIEKRYNKEIKKHEASLGLQYRAYFYKMSQTLINFDGDAFCVYDGDEITTEDVDGFHSYTYKKNDIFASGQDKIKGVIVRLTYTVGGQPRQKLGIVGFEEIMKIRSKAKTKFIWDEWFDEKAKAAATRRACKGLFDISQGLKDLVEYENTQFDVDKPKEVEIVKDVDKIVEIGTITQEQAQEIRRLVTETKTDEKDFLEWVGEKSIETIPADVYAISIEALNRKMKEKA